MATEAVFTEAAAEPKVDSVAFSHLSIELGHLYMEDFARGEEYLRQHFRHIAPWVAAATASAAESMAGRRARISTCFLVDDYFTRLSSPAEVIPLLVRTAAESGLRIDYLARESGCAEADGVPIAELMAGRLVAEPPINTNGSRPPTAETGWLSNGERSPSDDAVEAMSAVRREWQPPRQNSAKRHSIFMDVELWDEVDGRRTWSCPFLAAVWQLLRLGLLRDEGRRVAEPTTWSAEFPDDWARLPAVVRLNPDAAPFSAYRTMSILGTRFLPIEHAVRTILSQVSIDPFVSGQALDRSAAERIELPPELVDRIDYLFAGASAAWR